MEDKQLTDKTVRIAGHIVIALTVIGLAVIAVLNFLFRVRVSPEGSGLQLLRNTPIIWGLAAVFAGCICLCDRVFHNVKDTVLVAGCSVLYLIVGLFLTFSVSDALYGDPYMIQSYIPAFLEGDYTGLTDGRYFSWNPYLFGMAVYEMLVARIHESVRLLYFLNVIWVILTNLVIWKIYRRLVPAGDGRQNRFVILFLYAFAVPLFHALYVYGTTPGILMTALSVLFFIRYEQSSRRRERITCFILCLITLSMACILKQNFMIMGMAISIVVLLKAIQDKRILRIIPAVLIILSMVSAQCLFLNASRKLTGIDFGSGEPIQLYIAMGMQENRENPLYNGWYNGYNFDTYAECDFDEEKAVAVGSAYIEDRISHFKGNPQEAVSFFYYKFLSTWAEPTYLSIDMGPVVRMVGDSRNAIVQSLYEGDWVFRFYEYYLGALQIVIFFLMIAGVAGNGKRIAERPLFLLPCIYLLGGILWHLISETKSGYVYYYIWGMLPYAATGFYGLFSRQTKRC